MCSFADKKGKSQTHGKGTQEDNLDANQNVDESEYYQLRKGCNGCEKEAEKRTPSQFENMVFVLSTVIVVLVSHMVVWAHGALPIAYCALTPLSVLVRTVHYWRQNWQYFMIDFCYFANIALLFYMWVMPYDERLFRVVFSLTNGPILVASVVYRNSLVYHHLDKLTSILIHLLPALVTFSIRWFPVETSQYWYQVFVTASPNIDMLWHMVVPFVFYFLHSVFYCLVVNVVCCPKEPYLTSYSYLAAKYDKLNFINGPLGQGIAYYGFSFLFCLTSLVLPLVAYSYFLVHCVIIIGVCFAVVWNGGSYYVHIMSKHGIQDTD